MVYLWMRGVVSTLTELRSASVGDSRFIADVATVEQAGNGAGAPAVFTASAATMVRATAFCNVFEHLTHERRHRPAFGWFFHGLSVSVLEIGFQAQPVADHSLDG